MIADIPWYFFMAIRRRKYRSISSFKRPMGHNAHLRNNSNGQSLFLYRVLIKREKWLSPFWELKVLIFLKVESPLPKDALCHVWLKWIFRRFKKKFDKEFSLFCFYLPFQKGLIFIWANFNPLHPRMPCTKFGCNWLNTSSSGKKDFTNFVDEFLQFCYFTGKWVWPFIWKKNLKSPSPKDALCQVCLKLAKKFWSREEYDMTVWFLI